MARWSITYYTEGDDTRTVSGPYTAEQIGKIFSHREIRAYDHNGNIAVLPVKSIVAL